jgi:hypothetical protein
MSKLLDCRYRGGDRRVIQLTADLDQGWHDLGGEWGFDDSGFLNYEIGSRFECRLRFVAHAPENWGSRTKFPASEYLTRLALGNNGVMIHGAGLLVDVPLDQPWHPGQSEPGESEPDQPSIHEAEPAFYSVETPDGKIEYSLEVRLAMVGVSRKFKEHEYAWGKGFAWTGGA